MAFHATSQNIRLEGNHILVATCRRENGSETDSRIDLNDYIGNSDGWFAWRSGGFSNSSRNIFLTYNHQDGPHLEGELLTADGSYRERQGISISDRIRNQDGRLVYVD